MNIIERLLDFCDNHQKIIWRLSIIVYFISSLLFFLFHTPQYGYSNISEYEMFFMTIFPIIIICSNKNLYKTSKITKRNVTLIYLTFFIVSVIELLGDVYSILIGEISISAAIVISVIMFIICAVMIYDTFYLAINNIKLLLKNAIKIIQLYFNLK